MNKVTQEHSSKYVHDLDAASVEIAKENARIRKEAEAKQRKFASFDNLTTSDEFSEYLASRSLQISEFLPPIPRAIESEMSALGAMMMDADAAAAVLTQLQMPSFGWKRNRLIWKSARTMYQRQMQRRGESIDIVTLGGQLRRDRVLEEIGGSSYLTECIEGCPSSANVGAYIREIQEVARLRHLFALAEQVRSAVLAPDAQPGQVLNAVRKASDAIDARGYADLKTIFEECK